LSGSRRPRRQPTDDWQQLRLLATSPAQETSELLRPIVLFGQTPAARARETGVPERTLRRKAARFDVRGMRSLFEQPVAPADDRRALPAEIRAAIVELKAEHPPLGLREIARICRERFGQPVAHQTVGRVLAAEPLPPAPPRRFPRDHEVADPRQRRRAIVTLSLDGWSPRTIAGSLATSRARVSDTLRRWDAEGWPGLEDRSRAPHHPATKVDLKAMATIRRLQANPRLGAFRVHAALAQQGIDLSPRTCGRILALHRALGAAQPEAMEPREPQPMPFAAQRRHQYWSVDVRYVERHDLGTGKPVSVIAVLENFSRAILASRLSPRQDLTAYLIVLREAIARFGAPDGIVSDSGGIFRATHARAISDALGIAKHQIEAGQAWQNDIETMFSVMRRMADHDVTGAATWPDLQAAHDRFVANDDHQPHLAHQGRPKPARTPSAVLAWVRGRPGDPAEVDRVFRLREPRRIRPTGCVRFRHWRLVRRAGTRRRARGDLDRRRHAHDRARDRNPGPLPGDRRARSPPPARRRRAAPFRHRSPLRAAVLAAAGSGGVAAGPAAGARPPPPQAPRRRPPRSPVRGGPRGSRQVIGRFAAARRSPGHRWTPPVSRMSWRGLRQWTREGAHLLLHVRT
jgi:transposase